MSYLKDIIARGDDELLFEELKSIVDSVKNKKLYDEIISFENRFREAGNSYRKDTIPRDQFLRERAKIFGGLLVTIDEIEKIPELINNTKKRQEGIKRERGLRNLMRIFLPIAFVLISAFIGYNWENLINRNSEKTIINLATTWEDEKASIFYEELMSFKNDIENFTDKNIQVDITPPNEYSSSPKKLFQQVNEGEVDALFSVSYNWINDSIGEHKVGYFFAALPFGKEFEENNDWIENGGGLELWQKYYDEHLQANVKVFPFGHSGKQFGGWYKFLPTMKNIDKLKMRIPPLQGELLQRIGAQPPYFCLQKDIKKVMESYEIGLTGAEWLGAHEDIVLGLHECTDNGFTHYIREGWHERDNTFELLLNKDSYNKIPEKYKPVLEALIQKYNYKFYLRFLHENEKSWNKLKKEKGGKITFHENFPEETKNALKKEWEKLQEEYAKNSFFREVWNSYKKHSNQWEDKMK
ncbi:MAG: hypothetical protein AB8H03_22995 [Saprospiraceae bacterium]